MAIILLFWEVEDGGGLNGDVVEAGVVVFVEFHLHYACAPGRHCAIGIMNMIDIPEIVFIVFKHVAMARPVLSYNISMNYGIRKILSPRP